MLTFDETALTSQFQSSGFYKDTAGLMDVVDLTASPTSEVLKERAELFSESKVVEFMTRIIRIYLHNLNCLKMVYEFAWY